MLCTTSVVRHLPAIPVEAIDTTAAGDAFNGALAAASVGTLRADLLGGDKTRILEDAVRFANAAGALTTTKRGAQESLPTKAEIEKLLAGRPHANSSPPGTLWVRED
jgi:sugar/nucleoside kinase (ribokinase family)